MLADQVSCTGCGACIQICPKGAIQYSEDAYGFPVPIISEETCIDCGKCQRTCPVLNQPYGWPIRSAYAAQITDMEALEESSSGGMFTLFAREIIRMGGVVFGCVWDKDYNAVIKKAESEEEIRFMRSSKYVWSSTSDAYPEVEKTLRSGQSVLYTGLPCQVAGLRNYLHRDYENLFLMDIFCHGAPSPMAFSKYLDTISDCDQRQKLNLNFRDKREFGVGVHITYNGKKYRNYERDFYLNPYYYSFYKHIIIRDSCFHCGYTSSNRVADISVGDYWGINNYHNDMDIRSGVSALLINSAKGAALLDAVKEKVVLKATLPENISRHNNLVLVGQSKIRAVPSVREAFFALLKQKGWKAAERRYLNTSDRRIQIIRSRIPRFLIRFLKK